VIEVGGQSAVTGPGGDYLVTGVPAGAQTVTVQRDGFLRTWRAVSVVSGQTLVLPDVTLLGGDVNGDDLISQLDAGEIGQAWNATPGDPLWSERADTTGDGAINVLDMVAVQYNWGREAPGPWPDSDPAGFGPR
jgi:hypothetical protein